MRATIHHSPARTWSLIVPAATLSLAVGMQSLRLFHHPAAARELHLATAIPRSVRGWSAHDEPLGPNEFVQNEARTLLNYDEVVNRVFERGRRNFGVYVAYWSPGKMPTQLVAAHTPDRCWTENGWRCLAMDFDRREQFAGEALKPAQWRQFEGPDGGAPTYVLYWHLVDGRVHDFGHRFNRAPDAFDWWRDAMDQALEGSQEQLFIRLTSNEPFSALRNDPGFLEVVRELESLGIGQVSPPTFRPS